MSSQPRAPVTEEDMERLPPRANGLLVVRWAERALRLTPNASPGSWEAVSAVMTSVLHGSLLPEELEAHLFIQEMDALCQSLGSGACASHVIRSLRSAVDALKAALLGTREKARKNSAKHAATTSLEIARAETKVYQSSEKSLLVLIKEDYRKLATAVERGELTTTTSADLIELLLSRA